MKPVEVTRLEAASLEILRSRVMKEFCPKFDVSKLKAKIFVQGETIGVEVSVHYDRAKGHSVQRNLIWCRDSVGENYAGFLTMRSPGSQQKPIRCVRLSYHACNHLGEIEIRDLRCAGGIPQDVNLYLTSSQEDLPGEEPAKKEKLSVTVGGAAHSLPVCLIEKMRANIVSCGEAPPSWVVQTACVAKIALECAGEKFKDVPAPCYHFYGGHLIGYVPA